MFDPDSHNPRFADFGVPLGKTPSMDVDFRTAFAAEVLRDALAEQDLTYVADVDVLASQAVRVADALIAALEQRSESR